MPKYERPTAGTPAPSSRFRRVATVATFVALGALVVAISVDVGSSQAAVSDQKTGRIGAMGGPVLDIPMQRTGVATAAGVEVIGSEVAMGDVPLDVTVEPTWTLVNTTDTPVALGEPHASVIEGCCPGPLTTATNVLAPGESTTLTFPLQMHRGMDGPHSFRIHVPVDDEVLEVGVTGDFHA